MAGSARKICSPLAVRSVLLLLASCAPLLSPAFLLSASCPHRRTSTATCFAGQAPTSAVTATSCSPAVTGAANRRRHAGNSRRSHTSPAAATMSGLSACATTTAAHEQAQLSEACSGGAAACSTGVTRRRRESLLVLSARGGGRSGGDSSRRRTDRPDEYSSDRKKGRGRGGRGGRGGRSGSSSSSSSSSGVGGGSRAPSPFEPTVDSELWGGESRLSTLDARAPAEFSRNIDCSELTRKPKFFSVEATEKECAALADRFSCECIAGVKADFRVVRAAGSEARRIKIKGRVCGDITQNCAATLEPFKTSVERECKTVIQEVSLDSVESTLWALEKDTETDDEIMEGDPLDLGEVAAQMLALCIDPYAKHPDFVSQVDAGDGDGAGAGAGNEGFAAGRFGMPAEGEDVVLDVETMRAFFDADD